MPRDLEHDRELLPPVACERERRRVARPQTRVTTFRGKLEILWVVISPTEYDEVLEPPRDEQLPVVDEPEIARA